MSRIKNNFLHMLLLSASLFASSGKATVITKMQENPGNYFSSLQFHDCVFIQPETLHHFIGHTKAEHILMENKFDHFQISVPASPNLISCSAYHQHDNFYYEKLARLLFPCHFFW